MFALKIALRYVLARKSHRAVNVIAMIAVGGVAVAVAAMVVVLSIYNGFEKLSEQRTSRMDPPLMVERADGRVIGNADSLAAEIAKIGGVDAAFPTITERALLVTDMGQLPIVFKGVGDDYSGAVVSLDSLIEAGVYATESSTDFPAISVGVGVANKLSIIPDRAPAAHLYVPRRVGRINPANPGAAFSEQTVIISGVFRVDNPDIDGDHILVPLSVARDILMYDTEATAIELAVTPENAATAQEAVAKALGDGFTVRNRIEQRQESYRMIAIEKWVTFMMLMMVLVIALFNIVSTLSLLVIEKRDNMSTLRALGATHRSIGSIFAIQGFVITLFGGIIGIILGVALALAQEYGHFITLGSEPGQSVIEYYPVSVRATDLLAVLAAVLAMSLVMSATARILARRSIR